MTDEDIRDIIADAINESLDVEWTARDGARSVMNCLRDNGVIFFVKKERLFVWGKEG